jgi:DNA-binding NtrC family response regulator
MRVTVWTEGPSIREADLRNAFMGNLPGVAATATALTLENGFDLDGHLEEVSRAYVTQALKETGQIKSRAAELLGLKSHQALTYRMRSLGMKA